MAIADNIYAEALISSVPVYNLDRGSASKYLRLDCPWCADKKGHLHFYLDNSISRCMRCGAWGNARYLFRALGLALPEKSGLSEDYFGSFKEISARLQAPKGSVPNRLLAPEIDLPEGSFPLAKLNARFSPHARVLRKVEKEWRISRETAHQLKWQWNAHLDAFVFPVFEPGEEKPEKLVYWSARSFDGKFHTAAAVDFAPYGILGSFHHPLRKIASDVYLVEGARDAAALLQENFWAVYLFGHRPNAAQLARLEALPQRKVLLLDSDVTESATALAERHGWTILYLPQGDPADHAGNLKATLSLAWQNGKSSPDRRFSHIRQKLGTTQIHSTH